MIMAIILESIPWCHLVVGILLLGFWTRDSPYLPRVDSVASSFRILVTFAIVLEVRGISFFQIPWTIMAEVCWIKRSQQALYEFSMLYCDSASSITLIVELRYSIALTLCWSYYYDPRCLRGSSSSLAMIYVPVWWLWPSLSKASRDAI